MAVMTLNRFTCDLCSRNVEVSDVVLPGGWVKLTLDDLMIDRSWHDVHVCESCAKRIADYVNAAKPRDGSKTCSSSP